VRDKENKVRVMRRFLGRSGAAVSHGLDSQVRRDLLALIGFLAAGYVLAAQLHVVSRLQTLASQYPHLPLNEAFGALFIAGLGLTLYGFTRSAQTVKELGHRVEAEERATRAAMHDQLTGLPNRRHLKAVLNWHMSRSGDDRRLAVIAINLDGFRAVNDLHGRGVADELLVSVAQLLNMRAGVDGFVARPQADEFVVVMQNKSEEELMDWISSLLTAIEAPFRLTSQEISTGATLGVAMAPVDSNDAETLLLRADVALRRAKEKTRGWFAFFKAGMDERVHERAKFEHDLWLAVSNDEIEPWFKPVARLKDGRICGFEVLPRWPHEERGLIEPEQFMPVAEGADLIEELTLNILRRACREAADWWGAPHLSINLPSAMLQDEFLPVKVLKILEETGFVAGRLEIELTETALESDFEAVRTTIASLKNQGIKITLDHFGVGHSSLGQLWALPFDKLKIDAVFVGAMDRSREAGVMVRTIAALAKNLNLAVVADGVATEDQMKALVELGCETGQGSLFGETRQSKEAAPVRESKLMITAELGRDAAKPAAPGATKELEKAG
jgi:diguanylate cyclase (GGDEF)-like protein